MKYEVITDFQGYVQVIRHTGTIKDYVELDLSQYNLEDDRLFAYKLGKNKLIFDANKYEEIKAAKQKISDQKEIKSLKQFLTSTDYLTARAFEEIMALNNPLTWVADVIKINVKYSKMYKDVIAERIAARKRIEELGG